MRLVEIVQEEISEVRNQIAKSKPRSVNQENSYIKLRKLERELQEINNQ